MVNEIEVRVKLKVIDDEVEHPKVQPPAKNNKRQKRSKGEQSAKGDVYDDDDDDVIGTTLPKQTLKRSKKKKPQITFSKAPFDPSIKNTQNSSIFGGGIGNKESDEGAIPISTKRKRGVGHSDPTYELDKIRRFNKRVGKIEGYADDPKKLNMLASKGDVIGRISDDVDKFKTKNPRNTKRIEDLEKRIEIIAKKSADAQGNFKKSLLGDLKKHPEIEKINSSFVDFSQSFQRSGLGEVSKLVQFIKSPVGLAVTTFPIVGAIIASVTFMAQISQEVWKVLSKKGGLLDKYFKRYLANEQSPFLTRMQQRRRQIGLDSVILSQIYGFGHREGKLTTNTLTQVKLKGISEIGLKEKAYGI